MEILRRRRINSAISAQVNTQRVRVYSRYTLGDTVVLTAAIRDLQRSYPGRFSISVDTGYGEVWENNPYVRDDAGYDTLVDCGLVRLDKTGETGRHYVTAYLDLLNEALGVHASISRVAGDIHLTGRERRWHSDVWELCRREIPYWIICPGGKRDNPIKWWHWRRYQEVVDGLRGKIQFVQVGNWGNFHPPLKGVIDLRGKTGVRDLIHLIYNADGVFCGVTALMHLASAIPDHEFFPRSGVIVAGARRPAYRRYHSRRRTGQLFGGAVENPYDNRSRRAA